MIEAILIGSGFAFAASAQPGPLQAFLLSSVLKRGWQRTLPAAFAPLLSDGPIAALILLALNSLPDAFLRSLRFAGGLFLIYLAWLSFQQWRQPEKLAINENDSAPQTLLQAATVNFLNPNVYIAWSLILGPAVMTAWEANPWNAAALVIAFYSVLITGTGVVIFLMGATRFLGASGQRVLMLLSSLTLAVLGLYSFVTSLVQ